MNEPVVIFDFQHHRVQHVGGDPVGEKALADAVAAQRELVMTAGGTPPPATPDEQAE
jgi:hypothetical protein